MLDHFPYMKNKVDTSENHLKTAIQYAMVGNYIDFGALENVNEGELKAQLDEAININIDSKLLDVFKNDLVNAKRLVYFTDNCGEIVTDKLLISTLRDVNPNLHITVIVRGKPVFPFRFTWNIFFKETDVSAPDTVFTINGRFQGNTDALAFCITYHID